MINTRAMMSLLLIGAASVGIGYGTFAFFSDTETSTNNIFTAGSLDLHLGGSESVTGTITATNFAPGDETALATLALSNIGGVFQGDAQGHAVDVDFKFTIASETDSAGGLPDTDPCHEGSASTPDLKQFLVFTNLSYNNVNLLPLVGDNDADGRSNTLNDVVLEGVFADRADPLAAGKSFTMRVRFDTSGANDLMCDAVNFTVTWYLAQAAAPDLT